MAPVVQMAPVPERRVGLLGQAGALWKVAPAWRMLVASTSVLVVSTALTPLLLASANDGAPVSGSPIAATPPPDGSCPIANWTTPAGEGTILGFLTASQAASLLARTQASVNAAINPAFVHSLRAVIGTPDVHGRKVIALVPAGMTVRPGDRIRYAGGFRDPTLPCNYVPPLISGEVSSR